MCGPPENIVIGLQQRDTLRPARQAEKSVLQIADPISGVVYVRQEDLTTTGEARLKGVEHPVQTCLKATDPGLRLLQCRAVQSAFLDGATPIVVDQVVAAGGYDHPPEGVGTLAR